MTEEELVDLARTLTVKVNNMIDVAATMKITVTIEMDYHQTVGGDSHVKINLERKLL